MLAALGLALLLAPPFVDAPSGVPVIDGGWIGQPAIVADPFVWADAEGYHLLFTSLFCREANGIDHYYWGGSCGTSFGAPAYAFSADAGLTWTYRITPVLRPGPEAWRSSQIETPNVARIGNTLILLYSAYGTPASRYSIGHATLDLAGRSVRTALLDESVSFTNASTTALIPANLTDRNDPENNTQEPSAMVDGTVLRVWYFGLGVDRPADPMDSSQIRSTHLRLATFDLGTGTTSRVELASPSPVNMPEVRRYDGVYHLFGADFGTGTIPHQGETLIHATSTDGLTWGPAEPLLAGGPGYKSHGIMAPTVVVEPTRLVMFYTAWERRDVPCTWTRMGIPELIPGGCVYGNLGRATAPR